MSKTGKFFSFGWVGTAVKWVIGKPPKTRRGKISLLAALIVVAAISTLVSLWLTSDPETRQLMMQALEIAALLVGGFALLVVLAKVCFWIKRKMARSPRATRTPAQQPPTQATTAPTVKKQDAWYVRRIRGLLILVAFSIISVIALVVAVLTRDWIGALVGGVLLAVFFANSLKKIPARPPQVGLLVILGKRTRVVLSEGWHILPFFPIITDAIRIGIQKRNLDMPEQIIRTPDRAQIGVWVGVTWQVDYNDGESIINFLNSGGEEGVMDIFTDIIEDRLRSWALSMSEGPSNWQEAIAAGDEAIAVLLKAILGDDLRPVPFFPTPVLLKYYNLPRIPPSKCEAKHWGKKWEKLEVEMNRVAPVGSPERANLEDSIEERQEAIIHAKQGNGSFAKSSLGIIIVRFTLNKMEPKGGLAGKAELQAEEDQERLGEKLELKHVGASAKRLQKQLGVSAEEAVRITQTERGKTPQTIVSHLVRVSPETLNLVSGIAELFKRP